MTTNLTNLSNVDSLYDLGEYAATSSGGLFWAVIMIALFIILIVRLKHLGGEAAVAASSFGCLILSLLLLNLNYLNFLFPVVFGIILASILTYNHFRPREL